MNELNINIKTKTVVLNIVNKIHVCTYIDEFSELIRNSEYLGNCYCCLLYSHSNTGSHMTLPH